MFTHLRSRSHWITALGVLALAQPALARGKAEVRLTAAADADASGRARLALRGGSDGRFEIQAKRLDSDASYDIILNDTKVGTLRTSGGGSGRARFRSRPRGGDQALGFDPRGLFLVVRNAAGEDVLLGTLPTAIGSTGSNSGGTEAGEIICCVPDDSGAECEDRTPDECSARGGTVSAATSCLPNPCAGSTPVTQNIVCCLPDDSGPECEDRTQAECASSGGIVVDAATCVDNPCAGIPAADPDIQCCLPDGGGYECEDRTEVQCAALGGIRMGAGSCNPDPCAALGGGGEPGDDNGVDAPGDDSGGSSGGGNSGSGGGKGGSGGGRHGGDDRGDG